MQAQRPAHSPPASQRLLFSQAQRNCARSGPPGAVRACAKADAGPEAATQTGWDPEGLLQPGRKPKSLIADHAARRAARRQAQQAQLPTAEALSQSREPAAQSEAPLGLSRSQPSAQAAEHRPQQATAGTLLSADPALHAQLRDVLAQRFWPVDLDRHPGAQLLHLDPPILRLPGFVAPQTCETVMQLAAAGGVPTLRPALLGRSNGHHQSSRAVMTQQPAQG